MAEKWLPGKGAFLPLNENMIDWYKDTIECIWDAAGSEGELNAIIDAGEAEMKKFLADVRGSSTGWHTEADSFGIKLYREMPWTDAADATPQKYRITIVITKGTDTRPSKLKLDIRNWYLAR